MVIAGVVDRRWTLWVELWKILELWMNIRMQSNDEQQSSDWKVLLLVRQGLLQECKILIDYYAIAMKITTPITNTLLRQLLIDYYAR